MADAREQERSPASSSAGMSVGEMKALVKHARLPASRTRGVVDADELRKLADEALQKLRDVSGATDSTRGGTLDREQLYRLD